MDLSDFPMSAKPPPKFIPREELGNFSAWRFDDVGGANKRAPREPELTPGERAAFDQGYRAGHEAGRQEAEKKAGQAIQAFYQTSGADCSERLASLQANYGEQLRSLEQHLAAEVLALSFDIARQVLRSELASRPAAIEPLVHEALGLVLDAGAQTHLRLNGQDLQVLSAALQPLMHSGKLRCSADASVSPGGCIVESGLATVDATLEKRWARVLAQFGQHGDEATGA